MNVIIRPTRKSDVAAILEINNYEIVNSTVNYDFEPKTLDWQLEWFDQKMKAGFPVLVAEGAGKVLGFATYGTFRPKPGYSFTVEHSVYISLAARGKGIGKLLMINLIQLAKNAGYHTMVGGIDGSNDYSYRFHEKLGFREVARFKETARKFDS
jgi:phosphinothricin acetyltransferase